MAVPVPSNAADASPGLNFGGPSGLNSRTLYRAKVSTIGESGSKTSRKRGLWDGLGDTLFTDDDEEEDLESLKGTELERVEGMGTPATDNVHQRREPNRAAENE